MVVAYKNSTRRSYKNAGIAYIGANLNVFVPPDTLDISDRGYSSSNIDDYLIYHAANIETLNPNRNNMDVRGNDNPTSASADARQTLYDNYVLVNYNEGYSG